ncbi:MAG TPA: organomercurial lyase [Candidatus Limnocylindria bacterium]|nr:organomercurial lyase [Candidatus Limnocylindria bacterium]
MDEADIDLRNATYQRFVALGRAPTEGEVGEVTGLPPDSVVEGWRRLHDAHALVLDTGGAITMANPFAGRPTPFRVEADGRSWYANCGWDAFGIGAALRADSIIRTSCADCAEPMAIHVRDGHPLEEDVVWHVLVPAATWWNDIGFT